MGRRFDAKRPEFPDPVRLVGVTVVGSDGGPGPRRTHPGHLPQARKAKCSQELLPPPPKIAAGPAVKTCQAHALLRHRWR